MCATVSADSVQMPDAAPEARRGPCRLDAGMTRPDHHDIELTRDMS